MRVSPRAACDQIGQVLGDRLKVAITAPPVDGKANRYLLKFFSKQFKVPTSRVRLVSGTTGRDKTIRVELPDVLPAEFRIERPSKR